MTVTVWLAHRNHQLLLPLWRFEQGLASQRRTRLREFLLLRSIEPGIAEVGRAQPSKSGGLQVVASVNLQIWARHGGVNPTKDALRDNVSEPLDRAPAGRVLPERTVRPAAPTRVPPGGSPTPSACWLMRCASRRSSSRWIPRRASSFSLPLRKRSLICCGSAAIDLIRSHREARSCLWWVVTVVFLLDMLEPVALVGA